MNKIVTGLDIGTSQVKTVVLIKKSKTSIPEVLGVGVVPCFGMKKGVIVDFEKVSKSIKESLSMAERLSGQKINKVFASIKGKDVFQGRSYGVVVVAAKDGKISKTDIKKVNKQALNLFSLPANKEIVHVFPKEYIVDKNTIVDNPLGMKGLKLEVNLNILGADRHHIQELTKAINNSGVSVDTFILSFLSSTKTCLSGEEIDAGVVLLDIGAQASDLSIFRDNNFLYNATLPIGDRHITNDIAVGLKIDLDLAEKIKIKYDYVLLKNEKLNKVINLAEEFNVPLSFSERTLNHIIKARVLEIFDFVEENLKKFSQKTVFPFGFVITGGGAKLSGILDIAKEHLKMNVRISDLKNVRTVIQDPSLSTACGLALWGIEIETKREQGLLFTDIRDIREEVQARTKRIAESLSRDFNLLKSKFSQKRKTES